MYIFRLGKLWLFITCAIFAAFIANQNLADVTLNLQPMVKFPMVMPAYKALGGAFILGVTVTMVFFSLGYYKQSFALVRIKRKLRKLEAAQQEQAAATRELALGNERQGQSREPRLERDLFSIRD